ncbi:MAG TPA: D-aminoacylase [Anaerolineae bacterium]|nr:D-aminoacylase [Anaerolineae bacterium]
MDFELAIANATVIDGTGRPRFRADLGIQRGKIAAIATGERLSGHQALDAAGLVVAPGFIDVHSHADWILPLPDHDEILAPLLLQGVTTLVTGNCGFSPAPATEDAVPLLDGYSEMMRERAFPYRWRSFAEFLDALERDGLLLNAAFLVGHGALRYAVMGGRADGAAPPAPGEIDALCRLTRQALREGTFGLSAGLAYAPGVFARNEELLPLLQVVAEDGGVFTVHGRAYTWVSPFYTPMILGTPHNVRSTRELLALARQAGVRLQLSHLIFVGRRTWRTHRTVLHDVERAAAGGLDVAFDAFPYTVGNSTINVVFPEWFLDGFDENIDDPRALRRLKREMDLLRMTLGLDYRDITLLWGRAPDLAELEGLDFGAIARRLGLSAFEAYAHVARASNGKARVLLGTYSGDGGREEPLRAALAHPLCAVMTDTILTRRGRHNPASFGTFPRVLGRYSRDLGLFPLEEAVRRMTSFPAERIGLADVGCVAEGAWADLVLFDPATIADNTTLDRPDAPPAGIRAVLISGQVVAQDGRIVGRERWGRVLRG